MTILGSLGAVTPASQTGDAADSALAPEAETLALFASLFAMMQPQARTVDAEKSADPAVADGDPAATLPAYPDVSGSLPAAAMLLSGATQNDSRQMDDRALADIAPLSHLLTVAKTMTGAEAISQAQEHTALDADQGEQAPDVTTAKAILVRAIAILDDFDSGKPAVKGSDIQAAPVAAPTDAKSDFVGPMPAAPVRMVAEAAPSPDFVGPMPAAPVRMVAEAPKPADPSRPAPVLAGDSAPRPQMTSGITLSQPAMLSNEVSRPGVSAEGFAKAVDQDDAMTSAEPRPDRQTSLKDQGDQANKRIMVKPESGYEKVSRMPSSPGSEATQAPVVNAREMRATMDQPATNNGQSSSAASTSLTNATTAGGQSGSQGQSGHQSGQGGGQSASQHAADAAPSRDVADRTMLHRLNTANAGWSETMIKRLTSDLRAGVQSVRIILEPRNLGRLNVDLGLRDGKASIRIAAETAEAASLLAGARGQLSQMLEQSGMRLAGFQSSAGGQEAQGDTGGGQQGHAQQESGGKNTGRNGSFSNKLNAVDDGLRHDEDAEMEHDLALRPGETAVLSVLA